MLGNPQLRVRICRGEMGKPQLRSSPSTQIKASLGIPPPTVDSKTSSLQIDMEPTKKKEKQTTHPISGTLWSTPKKTKRFHLRTRFSLRFASPLLSRAPGSFSDSVRSFTRSFGWWTTASIRGTSELPEFGSASQVDAGLGFRVLGFRVLGFRV